MNSIISEKIEINKRMIGKTVKVAPPTGMSWTGEVSSVVDEETFVITDAEGESQKVNIHEIRSAN